MRTTILRCAANAAAPRCSRRATQNAKVGQRPAWPRLHRKQRESAMAEHNANRDSPISESLHPLVNIAIIGLVSIFVAAVWMFFDSDPYGAWLDVVITGLLVVAIAIPALCWLTR